MGMGQKLKELREENQLTQADVSERLCISRQSISKWENDKGYPDLDNLIELSNLFKISVDDLLKENSKNNTYTQNDNGSQAITSVLDEWIFLLFLALLLSLISPLGIVLLPVVLYRNKRNEQFHKTVNIACILCLFINLYSAYVLIGDYFHNDQSSIIEYTSEEINNH